MRRQRARAKVMGGASSRKEEEGKQRGQKAKGTGKGKMPDLEKW